MTGIAMAAHVHAKAAIANRFRSDLTLISFRILIICLPRIELWVAACAIAKLSPLY
jgi:hypothetical protein